MSARPWHKSICMQWRFLPVWSRSVVVCVINAIAHAGINVAVALLQADGLSTVIMGDYLSTVIICPR